MAILITGAAGFIGKTGRGTVELKNVVDRVDIITGTLGKALCRTSRQAFLRTSR